MNNNSKFSYILASITIVLWSTVATAFKLGLNYFSEFELVFYASLISAVTLTFLSILKYKAAFFAGVNTRKKLTLTVSQALLNPFLYYLVLFGAYSRLPAQVAQPINFTWPIFLSIFAVIFLGEKFSVRTFPALILSFAGIVIVSLNGNLEGFNSNAMVNGVLLGLASAVIWALYWILNLKDSRAPLMKLSWGFLFSLLFIVGYGISTNQMPPIPEYTQIIYPVYIGLFEMSITFLIWIIALEKAKNTPLLSNLVYLIPILSLVIIRIVLKEEIQHTTLIGLVLIIAGVVMQAKKNKRNK